MKAYYLMSNGTSVLGIDFGGSGIKGAPVDIATGTLLEERHRIPTPTPATPEAVTETIVQIANYFSWNGLIGCGFPSVIKDGFICTASNISPDWIGVSGKQMVEQATGCPCYLINDADAAGLAEMRFGAGVGKTGLVLLITIGTGIGTALFMHGVLVPNTELGHIQIDGIDAETYASDAVRKTHDMKWKHWAKRLDVYLHTMEQLFWPDLIIIGGGASKKADKFFPFLTITTDIMPASLLNQAGIIGAALAAHSFLI